MIKLVLKLVVKVKVTKLVLKLVVLKLILKLVLKSVLLIKGWLMFCALGRPAASPNLDGKCGRWPHFPSRFPRQRVAIFLPPTDVAPFLQQVVVVAAVAVVVVVGVGGVGGVVVV